MAKIHIETTGCRGHVWVDGKEVPDVRRFSVSGRGGELPVFHLEIVGNEITFDGDGVIPVLPEPWAAFYEPKPC